MNFLLLLFFFWLQSNDPSSANSNRCNDKAKNPFHCDILSDYVGTNPIQYKQTGSIMPPVVEFSLLKASLHRVPLRAPRRSETPLKLCQYSPLSMRMYDSRI